MRRPGVRIPLPPIFARVARPERNLLSSGLGEGFLVAPARSVTEPNRRCPYSLKIDGRKFWRWRCYLRRCANMFRGPDLNKTHKTVCEYDRPEYQQSNVSTKVEG